MSTQLAFPPHQGLPFQTNPPTIDGYIEPDPGIPIRQLEAGYVGGSRYTFADTSGANSTGAATVAFQGIRHATEDLIYLGFIVRFDFSFDEDDRIVVCLRPSATAPGNERRIDIRPNFQCLGAGPTTPHDGNDITTGGLTVTTNRLPRFTPDFYTPTGGHPAWQAQATLPSNLDVRVRSSQIGSGSNTTAIYWSIELQLPTKTTGPQGGGSNWIDLQTDFGLYFNAIRVCSSQPGCPGGSCSGMSLNGDFCAQFPWPDPSFLITDPPTFDIADWKIPSGTTLGVTTSYYGEGILASAGPSPAKGVHFRNEVQGIGILSGGTIGTSVDMGNGVTNTIVARVFNDDSSVANGVSAEFRLADFGLGPYGNSALWDRINIDHNPTNQPGGGNPTPPQNIPTGSVDVDLTANWTINNADRTKYGPLWHDQCLWALLDSGPGASIAENSMRRNLALINLSKAKHPLTVSGRGHPHPPGGAAKHDFMLHVVDVKYPQPTFDEGPQVAAPEAERFGFVPPQLNLETTLTGEISAVENTVTWLHVVNGYRCTGKRLTLGKKRFTIWTLAGACAFVAQHQLEEGETFDDAGYAWEFDGGGIKRRGRDVYYLQVPHDGDVALTAQLEAGGGVKPGDPTPVDKNPIGPRVPGTVQEGATGELVRQLQFLLSVEGYGIGAGEIDGNFGARTKTVVEAFQGAQGLQVDGVVGPSTWTVLLALDPVATEPFPPTLQAGASGLQVAALQQALNGARRWFAVSTPQLAVDSDFGSATTAMVQALQGWASLNSDGSSGYQTWAANVGPSLWDVAGVNATAQTHAIPPTVQEGSHGDAAQNAQFLLSAEGYGLAPAGVDGTFGAGSRAAAERLQRAHHATVDGVVGPATWKILLGNAPIKQHPFPATIQHGAKGPLVPLLQQALNVARPRFAATTAPLTVDGDYGPATVAMVRAFQDWGAVIVDGIVGPRTWSVAVGGSLWSQ